MTELKSEKSAIQLHAEWVKKASWNEIVEENFEGIEKLTLADAKGDLLKLRRKIHVK